MNTINLEERVSPKSSRKQLKSYLVYLTWFQAVIATLGSLFFSEVMHLAPCLLCWYQRIMMYPLVFILTSGILLGERRIKYYVLPLSLVGLAISVYHNLLYYKLLPESIAPCTTGVSCTTRQIEWLGFITIPLMSLIAFAIITLSIFFYKSDEEEEEEEEEIYDSSETQE